MTLSYNKLNIYCNISRISTEIKERDVVHSPSSPREDGECTTLLAEVLKLPGNKHFSFTKYRFMPEFTSNNYICKFYIVSNR